MRRRALAMLGLALAAPWSAATLSRPPELAQALPGARLRGEGRMRFFGLQVYDIRLWSAAPVGPQDWAGTPLALELAYARTLEGPAIAERSLQEMRRQGDIPEPTAERWLAAMRRLFPDVAEGDRLTGLYRPEDGAEFFYNGRLRGALRETEFARRFFGIWLAPQTSEPALRGQLLGVPR